MRQIILASILIIALLIDFNLALANQPPLWAPVNDIQVPVGHTLQFLVEATDPEGAPISYRALLLPAGAKFDSANRLFSWTPSSGQEGSYPASFAANDGAAESQLSFTIIVGGSFQPKKSLVLQQEEITNSPQLAATVFSFDKITNPALLLVAIFVLLLVITGLLVVVLGRR